MIQYQRGTRQKDLVFHLHGLISASFLLQSCILPVCFCTQVEMRIWGFFFFFNSMSFPNVQLLQKHPSFLTLCWSTLKVQCVEVTALTVSSIFYSILLFTLCPSCLPSLLVQLLLSSHSTSLLSLLFSPFFYLLSDFLSPYQTLKIGL